MKELHHHNFEMTVLWQTHHNKLELLLQAKDLEDYENICFLKCCELYGVILNISLTELMNQNGAYHILYNQHVENVCRNPDFKYTLHHSGDNDVLGSVQFNGERTSIWQFKNILIW